MMFLKTFCVKIFVKIKILRNEFLWFFVLFRTHFKSVLNFFELSKSFIGLLTSLFEILFLMDMKQFDVCLKTYLSKLFPLNVVDLARLMQHLTLFGKNQVIFINLVDLF
jgi:hypothetical protein